MEELLEDSPLAGSLVSAAFTVAAVEAFHGGGGGGFHGGGGHGGGGRR